MGLFSKFLTVGSATMSSRVLGFVRELLIASLLGTGPVADAFYAAFEDICIEDIAHALGNICRFNGHVNEFYSVAEHCIHVSNILDNEHAKANWQAFFFASIVMIPESLQDTSRRKKWGIFWM